MTDINSILAAWRLPVEPQQLAGLRESEYAAEPGVRSSLLKRVEESPWHALRSMTVPSEPSDAMALGECLHALCLEGPTAMQWYHPSKYKSVRAASAKVIGAPPGTTVIPSVLLAQAVWLCGEIAKHDEARELLTGDGWNEDTFLWSDPTTGLACKSRIDRTCIDTTDGQLRVPGIVDIKTTSGSCGERAFARTVHDYGYDVSAAHYLAGFEAVLGVRPPFRWIVVESQTGAVAVHRADAGLIDWAESRRQRMLATLSECIKNDRWPMPAGSVIERPRWAKE